MTVDELIEKLKEFDGDLKVESIEYASSRGCCGYEEMEYDYGDIVDPYLAKGDVVRIDARGC